MNTKKERQKRDGTLIIALVVVTFIAISFVLSVHSTGWKWKNQIDLGQKYLEELDYERAIIAYRLAIEILPKQEEAYLSLAEIYGLLGDYINAAAVLEDGYAKTRSAKIAECLEELRRDANLLLSEEGAWQSPEAQNKQDNSVTLQPPDEEIPGAEPNVLEGVTEEELAMAGKLMTVILQGSLEEIYFACKDYFWQLCDFQATRQKRIEGEDGGLYRVYAYDGEHFVNPNGGTGRFLFLYAAYYEGIYDLGLRIVSMDKGVKNGIVRDVRWFLYAESEGIDVLTARFENDILNGICLREHVSRMPAAGTMTMVSETIPYQNGLADGQYSGHVRMYRGIVHNTGGSGQELLDIDLLWNRTDEGITLDRQWDFQEEMIRTWDMSGGKVVVDDRWEPDEQYGMVLVIYTDTGVRYFVTEQEAEQQADAEMYADLDATLWMRGWY